MSVRKLGLAALAALMLTLAPAWAGPVLDRVKAAGTLTCGALAELDDWNKSDIHGAMPDFDRDICRGVAAAVLGSPAKVRVVPIPSERMGFEALKAGKVDLVLGAMPSGAATVAYGVAFTRPVFYDWYAVLVHKDAGIKSFADLEHRTVCFPPSTPAEDVLKTEMARRHVAPLLWPYEENGEMLAAVAGRKCDALFNSVSRLGESRADFHARAKDFVLLPERFAIIPVAPAVAGGDAAFAEVVDAVAGAPVLAESGGVDAAHAASLNETDDLLLRGLAGTLPGIPAEVVAPGWGARVIAAIGNASELYDRDLGEGSELRLPRGPNVLVTDGGLMVPELIVP